MSDEPQLDPTRFEFLPFRVGGTTFQISVPRLDDAPDHLVEGLVRRRWMFINGVCECGATIHKPTTEMYDQIFDHAIGEPVPELHFREPDHADGCPALTTAIARWLCGLDNEDMQ